MRCLDLPPATGKVPATIPRFEPTHDPEGVLGQSAITARQLLQGASACSSGMINRGKQAAAQQFGQLAGVDLVILAAPFQSGVFARIPDDYLRHVRQEQII